MARRFWLILVLVAATLASATGTSAAEDPEIRVMRIGTGPTGGSYFPIGGLIANLISNPPGALACAAGGSCGVPGLIASALSTDGSVENIVRLSVGDLDMALVQADVAKLAYLGEGPFAKEPPHDSLRAIAGLHPEAVHVVTSAHSGVQGIADLRGKRVSLGAERSGTRVTAGMILEAYGLSANRFDPVYEDLNRSSDMLADGEIDAFFMVGGHPLATLRHAAELHEIRLLPVTGDEANALVERFPFLFRTDIPAGTYHRVDATPTLSVRANLAVDAAMTDALVYAVTKALWRPENVRLLSRDLPQPLRVAAEDAISGAALPLHPGAARFYREAGLTADALVSQ